MSDTPAHAPAATVQWSSRFAFLTCLPLVLPGSTLVGFRHDVFDRDFESLV